MRSATGPRTHNITSSVAFTLKFGSYDGAQGHGIGGPLPLYHHFFFVLTRLTKVFSIALIGEFKLRGWVRHGEEIKENEGKKGMMRTL